MSDPKKKKPERRGPTSPGSPDNMKGVEEKQSNPDGATPAELPTVTPHVPTQKPDDEKED